MAYSRRTKRFILWSSILACVLVVPGFLVWLSFQEEKFDTRGYFLVIHITSPTEHPVIVACIAHHKQEQAQGSANWINKHSFAGAINSPFWRRGTDSVVADPFEAKSLRIENVCYHSISYFGRTLNWSQNRFMTVYAEWADGRNVCKVVEIPDARVAQEMTVQLP
jgi:hypothetical protein